MQIRVLQIIDTLHAGGAERLAVNYANELTRFVDQSHLCVTRLDGILKESLNANVGLIFLNKTATLDLKAVIMLYRYCVQHKINIIHAHSSSFFIAWIMKMIMPKLKLVWHDHYGNSEFLNNRPKRVIKFCSKRFSQIFSVNKALQTWAQKELLCKKVDYLQNFPVLATVSANLTSLHGEDGKRIVCLANLRQQKNHMRLLEAFRIVSKDYPDWSLHCVGKDFNDDYSEQFLKELKNPELKYVAFFYDSKIDILNILQQCVIGILVSKSEGLPLALLEYGLAGLAVISTDVGECKSVLPNSDLGILLENDDASTIANAIVNYIENQKYRENCGVEFMARVDEFYSKDAILKEVVATYKSL